MKAGNKKTANKELASTKDTLLPDIFTYLPAGTEIYRYRGGKEGNRT
jgi:hypothetical protein